MKEDTIVAISTPAGKGAISIVRLTGVDAIDIVSKKFKGKSLQSARSHTIVYGHIIDEGEVIDEVMVGILRAPKTFTAEDMVEIHCHGGIFVTNKVLETMILAGARLAEAGEFTKRAFLNGRIDLTQAEAVIDVIDAQTKSSLKMANKGLSGEISKKIREYRQRLLTAIAQIEVNIDYPEYYDEVQVTNQVIQPIVEELILDITETLKDAKLGVLIKEGIDTAIIGKPNVGKSSLLNALLREDRAIVTDIAGTTRDTIEAQVNLSGLVLNLIDTAGIRETQDIVEKIGVNRSFNVIDKAELVLLLFDYSQELQEEDFKLLEQTKDKKRIIIVNKQDLKKKIDLNCLPNHCLLSTYNEQDIKDLEKKIKQTVRFYEIDDVNPNYMSNARQIGKLSQALQSLDDAKISIIQENEVDLVALDLQNAWNYLGEIIGETGTDTLINELFSKFCLGK